jgi:putative permease
MNPGAKAIILERRIKLVFFISCLALLFLVVTKVENLLVSFLLAFVGFYILAPIVDFMERKGISRVWATTIPFICLVILAIIFSSVFAPQISLQIKTLQTQIPNYMQTANNLITGFEKSLSNFLVSFYPVDITDKLQKTMVDMSQLFLTQLPDIISNSFTVLIMAPFLTFFMLLDGRDYVRKIISMIPNNLFELVLHLNYQISSQLGGFIRARLIESIIVGMIVWLGLLLMGFPYSLILGLFAGLLNIIPYVGPLIGALPAFIVSFANGGNSAELWQLALVYGISQIVDTVVLVPFLVAKIVDLHPVTVVLSVLIGSQLMGILGMIICIPVVSTLKVTSMALYKHFTDFRT